eukprot:Skav222691  [mRNA]  locus=scaffold402:9156:14434:+ [translate_table: standard]
MTLIRGYRLGYEKGGDTQLKTSCSVAVRFALSFRCDEIYIISSAAFRQIDHDKILSTIRYLNKREVAIHAIGVEPDAHGELLLRNISESNHGDFTLKSFRSQGMVIPGAESTRMSNSFKQQTMTIGSQIRVLEVLSRGSGSGCGDGIAWNRTAVCAAVRLREEGKFEDAWGEDLQRPAVTSR